MEFQFGLVTALAVRISSTQEISHGLNSHIRIKCYKQLRQPIKSLYTHQLLTWNFSRSHSSITQGL